MLASPRWTLAGLTLAGALIGALGDLAAWPSYDPLQNFSPQGFLWAFAFSPLAIPCCGRAVTWSPEVFSLGGLVFWPIWGFLGWKWLGKEQSARLAVVIILWSAQGYFQILRRFAQLMSV
jgi:hypothetical protein